MTKGVGACCYGIPRGIPHAKGKRSFSRNSKAYPRGDDIRTLTVRILSFVGYFRTVLLIPLEIWVSTF